MQEVIERILKVEHGFKPIELEAEKIFDSQTTEESLKLALELYEKEDYQIRCLAVFLLGYVSSKKVEVLNILRKKVSKDKSWQVQEILAKAFDKYCHDKGYEESLPIIKDWLNDKKPNVCRAVTEGLRIWTNRPYFRENPKLAIVLISKHKSNESEYLRKSVGNSLRDISKKHIELINKELSTWDLSDSKVKFTFKLVNKNKK